MTVGELINKLSKLDPDKTVIIENNNNFVDGFYATTNVIDWDNKSVLIDTNYEERID